LKQRLACVASVSVDFSASRSTFLTFWQLESWGERKRIVREGRAGRKGKETHFIALPAIFVRPKIEKFFKREVNPTEKFAT